LKANKLTRTKEGTQAEKLDASLLKLKGQIDTMTKEIATLLDEQSALTKAQKKATDIRDEEKKRNAQTIKDAKAAQAAFMQQNTGQTPQDPSLVQFRAKDAGGVIGMLEVIQSDFARLEAETKAAEEQSQKEYEQFMLDSDVDKTQKSSDIEHKTKLSQDQQKSMTEKKADLEGTQKELAAALDYYEKLKPSCVDSGESYEDRVKRREEEIQSLKEALQILQGEDIAR